MNHKTLIMLLMMLSLPYTALASGYVANDQGEFYLSDGIVYFKGTMAGNTYADFVKLTGPNQDIPVQKGDLKGAIQTIYADKGSLAVLTNRGIVYKLGENSKAIFGGSPGSDTKFKYAAGSIITKITDMSHTPGVGAVYNYSDGTHTITNSSAGANTFGSMVNYESVDNLITAGNTKLALTQSGTVYTGETNATMENSGLSEPIKTVMASETGTALALSQSGTLYASQNGRDWVVSESNVDSVYTDAGRTFVVQTDGTLKASSDVLPQAYTTEGVIPDITAVKSIQQTNEGPKVYMGNDLYLAQSGDLTYNHMIKPTYDAFGFDLFGIHRDTGSEFAPDGTTVDRDIYAANGYDQNGYDRNGYDASGYDAAGFDSDGNSANGVNIDGFDIVTYLHKDTGTEFGPTGTTIDGDAYDQYGYNTSGFNTAGFNRDGIHASTGSEFDTNGLTVSGTRYDTAGYDQAGYDPDGYNRDGFDAAGLDRNGFYATALHSETGTEFNASGQTIDGDEFDSNGLTITGSEFGTDTLTQSDEQYGAQDRDYQGYDRDGFLPDGMHRNGTFYDDNGFNIVGWNRDGAHRNGVMAKNGFIKKDFNIRHRVGRESYFKTEVLTAQIKSADRVMLGRFYVRNNTRDGFQLLLTSAQGGRLMPHTTQDGEQPIPYAVHIESRGTIGTGIDAYLDHRSDALATGPVKLLDKAGTVSAVLSGTNSQFSLYVDVDDNAEALDMAGTYHDVITITYQDI